MVDAHQDAMLNVAFRITGSSEASWDIASEVFLRLLERPESVAGREGQIGDPLLHGVVALAVRRDVSLDEVPREDRAVEAVAETALKLPAQQRAALALGDHLRLDTAAVAAAMGTTPGAAGELLTESRLALAAGLGVRGRDRRLVEQEASRLYGLWPAEEADALAPDVVRDARAKGLAFGPSGHGRGRAGAAGEGGPVIAGVRITPGIGLLLLAVPLLIAAAIAVAVRSGGDGDPTPVSTSPDAGVTSSIPITDPLFPTTGISTGTTTRASTTFPVSTVSTSGAPSGGADPTPEPEPEPEPEPTTTAAPEPATTATPTVTREPGGGAPPRPTTAAPVTTSAGTTSGGGGAQPPAPTDGSQVPLP